MTLTLDSLNHVHEQRLQQRQHQKRRQSDVVFVNRDDISRNDVVSVSDPVPHKGVFQDPGGPVQASLGEDPPRQSPPLFLRQDNLSGTEKRV